MESRARTALVTGVTGQDGSYLAEFLLTKGYRVIGMLRRLSLENYARIEHLEGSIDLAQGDLLDPTSLEAVLRTHQPDEVYNLAAMSFVPTSWNQPVLTGEFTALGVTRLLDAIRIVNPEIRFYQASSSEMFGNIPETPQSEVTRFSPRSPYGVAKVYGHYITVNYRESYGIRACSGILFNHESPRRGIEFFPRKVSYGIARIVLGLSDELLLGNLAARRDWGFAGDYVRAMWMMLQHDPPGDYVIATGTSHSAQDLVNVAFSHVGLDPEKYVRFDPTLLRPADVDHLVGDSSRARRELGWEPEVGFEDMVKMMVDADIERVASEASVAAAAPTRTR